LAVASFAAAIIFTVLASGIGPVHRQVGEVWPNPTDVIGALA
jgi:hypothetical protein